MPLRRAIAAVLLFVLVALSGCAGGREISLSSGETQVYSGSSDSGSTWEAHVPPDPNGTLILFSHGYRNAGPNPAWYESTTSHLKPLLERGYSVVASSYATLDWAMGTAEEDQLDALDQFTAEYASDHGEFDRVIAYGQSMGGLVTGRLAERSDTGIDTDIDAGIAACGVMAGGVDRNNHQLDGVYAAAVLLADRPDLQISGFSAPDEAVAPAAVISSAITEARKTPAGRARIAVVAALLYAPTRGGVDLEDDAAVARDQARTIEESMPVLMQRRAQIAGFIGGDSGWNAGVDYAQMIEESGRAEFIEELYDDAGLDLAEDVERLSEEAEIEPDPEALRWMQRTSTLSGELQMPVLTMHTLRDFVSPVEVSGVYEQDVERAGESEDLRQIYADRSGHCLHSADETVLAVEVMEQRLDEGRWPDTSAAGLRSLGDDLGLGNLRFVDYTPEPFVSTREWDDT